MERNKVVMSVVMWSLVAVMLSQNMVTIPVMSCSSMEEQKNFYFPSPDPPAHTGTAPPSDSGGTPPSHHGGGSQGGFVPSNCGSPSPPGGGHHHTPTPIRQTPPFGGGYTHTPSTPITFTPPATPIVIPGTLIPVISTPSPPYIVDPNSPPFSCNYWKTHPRLIWDMFGMFGTMEEALGNPIIPNTLTTLGLGSSTNLRQALANVRTDGYGALYREGTSALLNSMVDQKFPFTTNQVRDKFISATKSSKAASAQAHVFKLANEARLKF